MSASVYQDEILRERWDDVTQTYTAWDETGTQIEQRPYTAEEIANAEVAAVPAQYSENQSAIETNLEADLAAMQAIKDQTNAELREDPSQEIKQLATAVRRLIKMSLNDFTEAE